jgi:hypothetical protein
MYDCNQTKETRVRVEYNIGGGGEAVHCNG